VSNALTAPAKKYKWLADLIDDRHELIEQLSVFNLSPRQEQLVKVLVDGGVEPLSELLKPINMSMTEFFEILRETRSAISEYKAKELIDVYRPRVVRAVLEGGLIKKRICSTCYGDKEIANTKTGELRKCLTCSGTGEIEIQPEHDRQKTALQISGVLAKQGPGIAVTFNNNNSSSAGDFRSSSDFRGITDNLMYRTKAVDAAVVKVEKEKEKEAKDAVQEVKDVQEVQEAQEAQIVSGLKISRPFGKH